MLESGSSSVSVFSALLRLLLFQADTAVFLSHLQILRKRLAVLERCCGVFPSFGDAADELRESLDDGEGEEEAGRGDTLSELR